jgi:predicted hydrocarbon binding protein
MVYLLVSPEFEGVVGFEFTLSNVPGALERVVSIISRHNLNIYYIDTCFVTREEYSLLIAIDFTGIDISPIKLLKEFKDQSDYVKDVAITPRLKNLIYPSRFCPMDLGGIRGIILSEANMRGIIEGMRRELGETVGDTLLFRMGFEIGKRVYKLYAKKLNITDVEEGIEVLKALAHGARWSEIIDYMISNNKIIIKLKESWECEIQKGTVDKPASNYIRGVFAGFFKELLKSDTEVRETKCIALEDPYCQFEVSILSG